MPSLPDVPGKSLLTGMTKRTRVIAAAAAGGAFAVGGLVVKRVLHHGGDGDAGADPIAETPTAPPGAEEKPVPKPKPEATRPKPAKAKPAKAKAKAGKAGGGSKPKAREPKASRPKPPKDPHHALNNPVIDDPDLTEYPDPYDSREDPRDPVDPDDAPFGEVPHPQTGAESTSEPPLSQDPEVENGGKPPRRDKLDD